MYCRTSSWTVLSIFREVIHSPFIGHYLRHSSGLGTCRDEKTHLLFSENLQSCKIGVGLENWGIRGEETLWSAPEKEDAVTTAQALFPY